MGDVVVLRGESEPGSSVWRRMDDCENAVRSFCRERAGERRRDVMLCVECECVVDVGFCIGGLVVFGSDEDWRL